MSDENQKNIHVRPRKCLSINILVLRVLGIWFPEERKGEKTWRSRVYILYAMLAQGVIYYLYTLSETINIIQAFGNIEEMTAVAFLLLTHVAEGFKIFIFCMNGEKIVQLLEELEKDIFTPKNLKQQKIFNWAMSRARSDSVTLLSMGIVTCALWAVFPFIEKSDGEPTKLPLHGWFPVDTTVSPNFELVFFYQMLAVTGNAMSNISMDTLATGIFIHVCAQIDMLKNSLENMRENSVKELTRKKQNLVETKIDTVEDEYVKEIVDEDEERYLFNQEELEEEMKATYKKCVQHHEEIIRYAEDIENIFNMCFLGQFAASVVIICLTLFKLSLVQSIFTLEFVSLVLYQACIIFELLLYCWHGNEMILKSVSISDSIYNAEWYEFSPKFSRDIILLMVRSKRPIRATSGKFFFLSLTTFTAILRSSWSYFAVLNSMHEEE